MSYDHAFFEQVVDRYNTVSAKWDGLGILYGNPDMSPMWIADMDFKSPRELTDAVAHKTLDGVFGYGVYGWVGNYRQLVVDWHKRRNGIEYDPQNVMYSLSALRGIVHALHGLTEKGDPVAMLTPAYGHFYQIVQRMQRTPLCIHLAYKDGAYAIDFDALETALADSSPKVLIFCNPHNPIGRVWTPDELTRMLEICKAHGVTVISDEVHSDLIMPGYTFTPAIKIAREIGYEENVAMTHGLSKTFNAAGLQVGYTIACGKTKEAIKEGEGLTGEEDMLNCFGFQAVEACYTHGDDYVDGIMACIAENFEIVKHALVSAGGEDNVVVPNLEGTYLMWPELKNLDDLTANEIKGVFAKNQVALQTEDEFYDTDGTHHLRINIAMPKPQIEVAAERLTRGVSELYGTRA